MSKLQELTEEWSLLHSQYQTFENYALLIKLFAITVVAFAFVLSGAGWEVLGIVLIFWLTEAVWKTFQSRTETDLRVVEDQIEGCRKVGVGGASAESAFQLYSRWAKTRPATTDLVRQYFSGLLQPTVAITYLLLTGLIVLGKLFG